MLRAVSWELPPLAQAELDGATVRVYPAPYRRLCGVLVLPAAFALPCRALPRPTLGCSFDNGLACPSRFPAPVYIFIVLFRIAGLI